MMFDALFQGKCGFYVIFHSYIKQLRAAMAMQ